MRGYLWSLKHLLKYTSSKRLQLLSSSLPSSQDFCFAAQVSSVRRVHFKSIHGMSKYVLAAPPGMLLTNISSLSWPLRYWQGQHCCLRPQAGAISPRQSPHIVHPHAFCFSSQQMEWCVPLYLGDQSFCVHDLLHHLKLKVPVWKSE